MEREKVAWPLSWQQVSGDSISTGHGSASTTERFTDYGSEDQTNTYVSPPETSELTEAHILQKGCLSSTKLSYFITTLTLDQA